MEVAMNEIRRSNERGQADHGWLKSQHSFSFADYFDPEHIEFGPLRVINEDRVQAGAGFGTHGHRNMEIISYVLAGKLAHKDSMGNGSGIGPGDVQRMSAGTGVMHSEFNPSATEPVHFLQIWIQPSVQDIAPSYEEKRFADGEKRGRLRLIASPIAPTARCSSIRTRACMPVSSTGTSGRWSSSCRVGAPMCTSRAARCARTGLRWMRAMRSRSPTRRR
jgi:redox-sensitive bicupin YhaK (pirin superfamily)